jgi:hypothetical protein
MSLSHFGKALKDKRIDLVLFDTCRMAFLESLMTLENKAQYFLASPFDVNGFDHVNPLSQLISNPDLSIQNLGELYVQSYPLKLENADQKEMAAAFLNPSSASDMVHDFEIFSSTLHPKDLSDYKNRISISVNEESDWDIDLFDLVKKAGESFPDLMMSSQLFLMKYQPLVLAEAQTPMTNPHSGLSVACADKQLHYRSTLAGRRLPHWRRLCHKLKHL